MGLLLSTTLSGQGPISGFMVGRARTDLAVSYSYESYEHYYFGSDKQAADNRIQSVNLFLEHGFSDSLAIVINLPYVWTDSLNRGLQDGAVALKYRQQPIVKESGSLSLIASAGISFPLSAYPQQTERPIGAGATLLQGRIVAQYNFRSGLFLHVQSGYDFRVLPEAQSAIPVQARAGFGAARYFVEGWLEWYHTFAAGADERILGGNGPDWLRLGGALYFPLSPSTGVVFNAAHFLTGRNIGLSTRVGGGLVWRIRHRAGGQKSR